MELRFSKILFAGAIVARFPVRTMFSIFSFLAAKTPITPTVSNTIFIIPRAMSAGAAMSESLPKFAAVISGGREMDAPASVRSLIRRSTLSSSPVSASSTMWSISSMPSIFFESPMRVPPPTPVPPRYAVVMPSDDFFAWTRAVPVPILITIASESPERYSPPLPTQSNSTAFVKGSPYIGFLIYDEPTPVIITFSISESSSPF